MASRGYRGSWRKERPSPIIRPNNGLRLPSRTRPSPYPDVWEASKDPHHQARVNLFKQRKELANSSGSSQYSSSPSTQRSTSRPSSSSSGEVVGRSAKARLRSISRDDHDSGVELSESERSISSEEFKYELERYENHKELLTKGEWVTPPKPRDQIRRISTKEFNQERIRGVRRWSHVQSFMYGLSASTLRETDSKQPPYFYQVGVIFSAPVHSATSSEEPYILYDDPNLTATPYGTICSKFRKMIVIKLFSEHIQCLPIYSYNGLGLEGKEKFAQEHVSIRDIDDRYPEPKEGPHEELHAYRDKEYKETFIKGKSVVKLTEIYCHRFDAPATIEGRLDGYNGSKRRLLQLVESVS
ncbi:uncharacterized protein F4822DRAFT_444292 [Hypoxylon trugodes]|uniref:uncharacterized protein n=1 Tax=Hypoxylon trugodes TaxID=326681 RepID=UPI002199BEBF|nr:uncharacterized protein F4822DRAFT_444292 [Hypoxylon trugodes]KAI1387693.1 hypothetical protein F4822DRAFT_444292 [Hypoxylon trugodes]